REPSTDAESAERIVFNEIGITVVARAAVDFPHRRPRRDDERLGVHRSPKFCEIRRGRRRRDREQTLLVVSVSWIEWEIVLEHQRRRIERRRTRDKRANPSGAGV